MQFHNVARVLDSSPCKLQYSLVQCLCITVSMHHPLPVCCKLMHGMLAMQLSAACPVASRLRHSCLTNKPSSLGRCNITRHAVGTSSEPASGVAAVTATKLLQYSSHMQ